MLGAEWRNIAIVTNRQSWHARTCIWHTAYMMTYANFHDQFLSEWKMLFFLFLVNESLLCLAQCNNFFLITLQIDSNEIRRFSEDFTIFIRNNLSFRKVEAVHCSTVSTKFSKISHVPQINCKVYRFMHRFRWWYCSRKYSHFWFF